MILVRTGGIFGLIVALMVAALFLFVVRPAINDTTDRAFDSADRALDEASRQTDEIGSKIEQATIDAGGDYLSARVLRRRRRPGQAEGRRRRRAARPDRVRAGRRQRQVPQRRRSGRLPVGPRPRRPGAGQGEARRLGQLADNVFPISKLDAAATAKLTAAMKSKGGAGFDVQTMTLGINPATGAVQWTVTGEGDGRSLVFQAKSDATGLKRVN